MLPLEILSSETVDNGDATLSESAWKSVKRQFAGYATFSQKLDDNATRALSLTHVHELLQSDARAQLGRLLELDHEAKPYVEALHDVERLVYAWCHLGELLRNFVSYEQFAGN